MDIVYWFDADGQVTKETLDLDFDGKVDDTLYFEKGKKIRSEKDLDGDGRSTPGTTTTATRSWSARSAT